jgi:hypothetical protein
LTRKVLDFLDLTNAKIFSRLSGSVTASAWQVRQKIYKESVARRRNYEKFIGPLLDLS